MVKILEEECISQSVVVITLKDNNRVVSREGIGMNLEENEIRGCLESEGFVVVYHYDGGYTTIFNDEVQLIETITEKINWTRKMEWIDSHNDEPSEFFMESIPSFLTFDQIDEFYENGFYLRDVASKGKITLPVIRLHFRYLAREKVMVDFEEKFELNMEESQMKQLKKLKYTKDGFEQFILNHLVDESSQSNDWENKYEVENLIEAVDNAVLIIDNSAIVWLEDGIFEIPFKQYESPTGFEDIRLFDVEDLMEISIDSLNKKVEKKQQELSQLQEILPYLKK